MLAYLSDQFRALRPAFTRQAAFFWFLLAFAGFVLRSDLYGVSSIVRALDLSPAFYPCLLHFFHSSAWSAQGLYQSWWVWLFAQKIPVRIAGRLVVLGDHTKQPKDARRMPQVTTLHQDSETSSKPSFFRGHHWACLSLLGQYCSKRFSLPLWAEIHPEELPESRAVRLVHVASQIAERMQSSFYLVLDAFFSVGSVFQVAAESAGRLHILTRAKKNIVAYTPPPSKTKKPGRPRVYGEKLHLLSLFDTQPQKFLRFEAEVYQKKETVRYLVLDLIWKPTKGLLRFFLIESSRGRLILLGSDLNLTVSDALQLYTSRVSIECLFASLKNLLGGLAYHFWSKYLQPVSRRPLRKQHVLPVSSNPEKTRLTLEAIHKFLAINLIVIGTLRLLASRCSQDIHRHAHCWLRTPCGEVPSEFVTRTALASYLRVNIVTFLKQCSSPLNANRVSRQALFLGKTGRIVRRQKVRKRKAA